MKAVADRLNPTLTTRSNVVSRMCFLFVERYETVLRFVRQTARCQNGRSVCLRLERIRFPLSNPQIIELRKGKDESVESRPGVSAQSTAQTASDPGSQKGLDSVVKTDKKDTVFFSLTGSSQGFSWFSWF